MEFTDPDGRRVIMLEPQEIDELHDSSEDGSTWATERLLDTYGELSMSEVEEVCATLGHTASVNEAGFLQRRRTQRDAVLNQAVTIAVVAGIEGRDRTYNASVDFLKTKNLSGLLAYFTIRLSMRDFRKD